MGTKMEMQTNTLFRGCLNDEIGEPIKRGKLTEEEVKKKYSDAKDVEIKQIKA